MQHLSCDYQRRKIHKADLVSFSNNHEHKALGYIPAINMTAIKLKPTTYCIACHLCAFNANLLPISKLFHAELVIIIPFISLPIHGYDKDQVICLQLGQNKIHTAHHENISVLQFAYIRTCCCDDKTTVQCSIINNKCCNFINK